MEIRFSKARQYPEDQVWSVAHAAGIHARVKWATTAAVRFQLVTGKDSYTQAPTDKQEAVIAALLALDPDATVRTARAIYEGREDYLAQTKARAES